MKKKKNIGIKAGVIFVLILVLSTHIEATESKTIEEDIFSTESNNITKFSYSDKTNDNKIQKNKLSNQLDQANFSNDKHEPDSNKINHTFEQKEKNGLYIIFGKGEAGWICIDSESEKNNDLKGFVKSDLFITPNCWTQQTTLNIYILDLTKLKIYYPKKLERNEIEIKNFVGWTDINNYVIPMGPYGCFFKIFGICNYCKLYEY